jgi:hypothetical protein
MTWLSNYFSKKIKKLKKIYIFQKRKKKIIGHLGGKLPLWPWGCLATPIWPDGGGQNHPQTTDDNDEKIRRRQEKPEAHMHLYKSKGQHILTNPRVLDSIVRKSHVKPTDTVLEIRPSIGNLTLRLLEAAKKVVANDGGTGNLTIGGGPRPPPNGQ